LGAHIEIRLVPEIHIDVIPGVLSTPWPILPLSGSMMEGAENQSPPPIVGVGYHNTFLEIGRDLRHAYSAAIDAFLYFCINHPHEEPE
jgi:hypothetical protein